MPNPNLSSSVVPLVRETRTRGKNTTIVVGKFEFDIIWFSEQWHLFLLPQAYKDMPGNEELEYSELISVDSFPSKKEAVRAAVNFAGKLALYQNKGEGTDPSRTSLHAWEISFEKLSTAFELLLGAEAETMNASLALGEGREAFLAKEEIQQVKRINALSKRIRSAVQVLEDMLENLENETF